MKTKSLFIFFSACMILSSCSLTGNKTKEVLENYLKTDSLIVNKTLQIDNITSANQKVYLSKNDNNLSTYSTIETFSNKLNNSNLSLEEFSQNDAIAIKNGDKVYNKEFASNNDIFQFLGLSNIFEDAQSQNSNKTISGTLDAEKCAGIVRSFLIDIGKFEYSHVNYYFDSHIRYDLYLDFNTKTITSLELDLTDIGQLINKSVNEVIWFYSFSLEENAANEISKHPFPSGSSNQDSSNETYIKNQGIAFINECYKDLKYVSDDLVFYSNALFSPKLSFKYESNKPNVIGHDGKYYGVSTDTEVEITVHLLYSSKEYTTLKFSFLAISKVTGTGDLGSQTNMLYKGRKPIDNVKIYFIEMHYQYGDSIYIQAGDFDMLIDAGNAEDGGYVNDFLRRHIHDGRLECVVATHAHGDHIGGMNTALSSVKNITYAVDYGYNRSDYSMVNNVRNKFKTADKYAPITDCINNLNGARKVLYITNDFYITFLNTGNYELPSVDIADYGNNFNVNDTSVTLMMTYKNQNFFFAGDLENTAQSDLLRNEIIKTAAVSKASHHGSSNANGTALLNKLKPTVSVISTALVDRGSERENAADQTHPIGSALRNLINYSSKVYCNFTTGTLEVTCDGQNLVKAHGLGLTSPYYINGKAVTGEEDLEFKNTQYAKRYRNSYI